MRARNSFEKQRALIIAASGSNEVLHWCLFLPLFLRPAPHAMKTCRKLLAIVLLLVQPIAFAAEGTDNSPFLLQFTHAASAAAGIGRLQDTPLPDGRREIRVWMGFGVLRVGSMLRLQVRSSGGVRGSVLVHYENDLSDLEPEDAADFRRGVRLRCRNFKEGTESNTCEATYLRTPNWRSVYKKLTGLGIATLPDESSLPPPELEVTDGSAMVVEIRDDAHYRAYEYSNPWARKGPEAAAAEAIMQAVATVMTAGNGAWQ